MFAYHSLARSLATINKTIICCLTSGSGGGGAGRVDIRDLFAPQTHIAPRVRILQPPEQLQQAAQYWQERTRFAGKQTKRACKKEEILWTTQIIPHCGVGARDGRCCSSIVFHRCIVAHLCLASKEASDFYHPFCFYPCALSWLAS